MTKGVTVLVSFEVDLLVDESVEDVFAYLDLVSTDDSKVEVDEYAFTKEVEL